MQHERKTGAGSKKGLYGFVIDEKTARRIIKASTETQRKRMRRESAHQKTKGIAQLLITRRNCFFLYKIVLEVIYTICVSTMYNIDTLLYD